MWRKVRRWNMQVIEVKRKELVKIHGRNTLTNVYKTP